MLKSNSLADKSKVLDEHKTFLEEVKIRIILNFRSYLHSLTTRERIQISHFKSDDIFHIKREWIYIIQHSVT